MKKELLRELPSVDEVLRSEGLKNVCGLYSHEIIIETVRHVLLSVRSGIKGGEIPGFSFDEIISEVKKKLGALNESSLRRIINASGTILHTNLGRAVLSKEAIEAMVLAASSAVNLEFDIDKGERGDRDVHVEELISRLTAAEDAAIVNNNAAALLITLNTLAFGKEVLISRGELIEIGGSFRLPEIIEKSGCVLKEVGTTNRTHPYDYTGNIGATTALILKVHTSNYSISGFTGEVKLKELVSIGRTCGIPVVHDLGSGSLIDLSLYGIKKEPIVKESIDAGTDVVTFSGDKLLGGPQSGIIAGKKAFIAAIKKNPIKRALRADKLHYAALEATLRLYLNTDTLAERLPTLRYIVRPLDEIEKAADEALKILKNTFGQGYKIEIKDGMSLIGSGALPGYGLPTKLIAITHSNIKPEEIFKIFLSNNPPILGRVTKEAFTLDVRCVENPGEVCPEKPFLDIP